ncbi:LPS-assembly protein LptD [Burkholderiaceae bacterium UC74_6]
MQPPHRLVPRSALRPALSPLCLAALAVLCIGAHAQTAAVSTEPDSPPIPLKPVRQVGQAKPDAKPALLIQARDFDTQLEQYFNAQGDVELRYGDLLLRSDKLHYDQVSDLARATGQVSLSRAGNRFVGPEATLYVGRFEGEFISPTYFFSATGGSGHAERISFADAKHVRAEAGTYSSCPIVEGKEPDWQISAKHLSMDFENNEGLAQGAVLRFLGVPILAAPNLSFALDGQRKSGWLPPILGVDNRSGVEFGVPYYWNIAPQRDATITPVVMSKRGSGFDSEFRYLEPSHSGTMGLDLMPHDRVAGRSRWDLSLKNDGSFGDDWRYTVRAERVSDDDYWKDMPQRLQSKTQRLLAGDALLERRKSYNWGDWQSYLRVQQWQALQGTDPTVQFLAPYQRSPQIGTRLTTASDDAVLDGFTPWGRKARLEGALELEYNRFDLSPDALPTQTQTGQRVHMLGHVSVPMGGAGWWLIPRASVNAASYSLDQTLSDGRRSLTRTIPTFSLDNGWVFERDTTLLGSAMRQTLEPRLLYVRTPYRSQDLVPNFDSAPRDFNFDSIYADNQFTGVDRVNDANQLTFGAVSRWIRPDSGDEVLRLGAVQRMQFTEQRITPDGSPPSKQRFSDLLLLGAVHMSEFWWADGTLQYDPENNRTQRSVLRARYSPGPFRTVSVAYRLARDQSEQAEVAWQWPLFGGRKSGISGGSGCSGSWYSAGRVQYSMRDKRVTDSVMSVEYDAGCWVMRMGVQRLSTGLSQTNTRLMLQLELVGLSQLGSNALHVLKDNIPGYRALSSERSTFPSSSND